MASLSASAWQHEHHDLVCFLSVEFLTVTVETGIFGIRLLPLDDPSI
ncbi:MAG: hypothetical protein M3067_05640 [Chloroflexota bacterium]|nr:hypothetical protein [Chloroflexota bacterium]